MVELLPCVTSNNNLLILFLSWLDAQVSELLLQIWISVLCSLASDSFGSFFLSIFRAFNNIFQSWLNHILVKLLKLWKVLELSLGLWIEWCLLKNLLRTSSSMFWAINLSLFLLGQKAFLFLFLGVNFLATEIFTRWFLLEVFWSSNSWRMVVLHFSLYFNRSSFLNSASLFST